MFLEGSEIETIEAKYFIFFGLSQVAYNAKSNREK